MKGKWSDHFPAAAATTRPGPDVSPCNWSDPSKMKGLWSNHFPAADKPSPPPPARAQRCFLCPKCNAATCRLITSNTPKNPGRQFYKCPFDNDFFKWADEVNQNEFIDVPYCGGCTAGVCRVRREMRGPNAGRILFTCRVKEGEGSCGYRVWQDELEKSAAGQAEERINSSDYVINCDDTSAPKTDLVEESKQTDEGSSDYVINCDDASAPKTDLVEESKQTDEGSPMVNSSDYVINCDDTPKTDLIEESKQTDEGSPMVDTSENLQCQKIISQKMSQLKCQEDKLNEFSRRPHKRSRCGDAIASASFHSLKVHLSLDSVPIRNSWIADANDQNLSGQLCGWWGRLAFHPLPSLMTYVPKPFTCYSSSPSDVSFFVQGQILVDNINSITLTRSSGGVQSYSKPLFILKKCRNALDFIPIVQDEILENSSDSITLSSSLLGAKSHHKPLSTPVQCHDAEMSGIAPFPVAPDEPSCSEPLNNTIIHNVMSKSILNVFGEAAERLQNDLVALLETMDVKDHKAMSQAAEATFDALDRLFFDHQEFKKRVKDFIHYASLLADIEQAMPTIDCCERLVEHCSSERMRLEEINSVHSKAINIVTNNKKRLKDLQEEISSTMDWLLQIEAEISCCEVKLRSMEVELEKVSKNKEVLEGEYLKASKELEESQKLFEQKEAEHNAAKAAFDRAKVLLRR